MRFDSDIGFAQYCGSDEKSGPLGHTSTVPNGQSVRQQVLPVRTGTSCAVLYGHG